MLVQIIFHLFVFITGLELANIISQPESQVIYEGQNAFFYCRLNGTNGRLLPIQWGISDDGPAVDITMNTTEYLILPPANSGLVVVRPRFGTLGVECRGANSKPFPAGLSINSELTYFHLYN